jgi:O-antigen/teichoic acid export membrane protein
MKPGIRKVGFDLASTFGARIFFIATGLVTSALTARFLGPIGRGEYFLCLTLVAVATQFGNLGLASAISYWAAKSPDTRSQLALNALWVSILVGFPLALIIAVSGMPGIGVINASSLSLVLAGLLVPFSLYTLIAGNLLIGSSRVHEYNVIDVLTRTFGVIAMITMGYWSATTGNFLVAALAAVILNSCLIWKATSSSAPHFGPDISLLKKGFGYAGRAWIAAFFGFAVSRINTLFVSEQLGHEALGIWSIAIQISDSLVIIPAVIGQVIFPRLVAEHNPWKTTKAYLTRTTLLMCVLCLFVGLVGEPIIKLVFGLQFAPAYEQLLWLLPGIFCLSLITIISQYLAAIGIPSFLLFIWGVALILEMVLAYYFIPRFGGIGAMASLSASYLFVLCSLWLMARRWASSIRPAPSE